MKCSKKDKRRLLIWSLLIFIFASYIGVFAYNYWSKILNNYRTKEDLQEKYEELLSDEKKLNSEVTKLQDPDYAAKYAREKYMYTKDGELIIRIKE